MIRVKEGSVGLKLNILKTKIMASGPTTSWQTEGRKVKAATDFIFLGFKITADGDCSHGRKAMTNLDTILKSRGITDKCPSSQSYGFSNCHVWMRELEHKEG